MTDYQAQRKEEAWYSASKVDRALAGDVDPKNLTYHERRYYDGQVAKQNAATVADREIRRMLDMMPRTQDTTNRGLIYGDEIRELLGSDKNSMQVADGMLVRNEIGGVNFVASNPQVASANKTIFGPNRLSEDGIKAAMRIAGYGEFVNDKRSAAYRVAAEGLPVNYQTVGQRQMEIAREREENKSTYEKVVSSIADSGIPGVSQLASGIEKLTVDMQDAESWGDVARTVLRGGGDIVSSAGLIFPEALAAQSILYGAGELSAGNYVGAGQELGRAGRQYVMYSPYAQETIGKVQQMVRPGAGYGGMNYGMAVGFGMMPYAGGYGMTGVGAIGRL